MCDDLKPVLRHPSACSNGELTEFEKLVRLGGEVAAGLFPLVFVDPVKPSQARRELVTLTRKGLEVVDVLIATHANFT